MIAESEGSASRNVPNLFWLMFHHKTAGAIDVEFQSLKLLTQNHSRQDETGLNKYRDLQLT